MLVRPSWEVANVSQIVWAHIVWLRWCTGFQPQLYACHFIKMETSNASTSVSVYFDSWALNRLFLTETSGHNYDLVIPCTVSVSFPFDILLPIYIKCDVTPIKMLFTLKYTFYKKVTAKSPKCATTWWLSECDHSGLTIDDQPRSSLNFTCQDIWNYMFVSTWSSSPRANIFLVAAAISDRKL